MVSKGTNFLILPGSYYWKDLYCMCIINGRLCHHGSQYCSSHKLSVLIYHASSSYLKNIFLVFFRGFEVSTAHFICMTKSVTNWFPWVLISIIFQALCPVGRTELRKNTAVSHIFYFHQLETLQQTCFGTWRGHLGVLRFGDLRLSKRPIMPA